MNTTLKTAVVVGFLGRCLAILPVPVFGQIGATNKEQARISDGWANNLSNPSSAVEYAETSQHSKAEVWGIPAQGAKLGLTAAKFLRMGQPFEFVVRSVPRSVKGPNLVKPRPESFRPLTLELTDARGHAIPFRLQDPIGTGFSGRLWPKESHARGRYWKPGIYYLRAVLELVGDPLHPLPAGTKVVSNTVRVEIAEPDAPVPSPLRDPEERKRILAWIEDLDSPAMEKRDAAEKALKERAVVALPLIENAMRTAAIQPFKRLLRLHTAAVTEAREAYPRGPYLASLEEETWKIVENQLGELALTSRVERACHMPILTVSEKELVKMLDNAQPDVRVRAIRSLPRTTNKSTLQRLLKCLDDPYFELRGFPNQFPVFPITYEAQEAIAAQGQQVVPLLLELASKPRPDYDRWAYRKEVAEILGRLGPSETAERFLVGMIHGEKDNARSFAVGALREWGRASVPIFLKIAQHLKVDDHGLNHPTLEHLTRFGEPDDVGDCLRSMLRPGVPDEHTAIALEGIRRLKLRDTVPDLKRIALSKNIKSYARAQAVQGLVALAKKEEAAELLMALAGPETHPSVRYEALYGLAELRHAPAVPKLLPALEEEMGPAAGIADWALRVLAELPEGVGYEEKSRNSEPWRKWWRDNKALAEMVESESLTAG
jgi:HEAT repeat protein